MYRLLPDRTEFHWKQKKTSKGFCNCCHKVFLYGSMVVGLMVGTSTLAYGNPEGGSVVEGSATIVNTATELQIHQSTDKALIEWSSFDIDAGETTRFLQPGTDSVALNRVVNSTQISIINGNLVANGRVLVINPNGVLIGPNGNIDTAGFIATSAGISNDAFMTSNLTLEFNKAGSPDAYVENQGVITVGEEGLAALVAPTVRNSGVIQGNLAKVQLAAADTFAVDLYGDGLIQFAVDTPAEGDLRTLTVENDGSIVADAGQVLLTAADASSVVNSVINNDGFIQAASLQNVGGKIILAAEGADITVNGTLDVSNSGTGDGGTINIGGGFQGGEDLAWADTVTVSELANIEASAGDEGNGGTIVVWSEESTTTSGTFLARGGDLSGDGGLVETSSKGVLQASGTVVDTRAPNGETGTWLLDPPTLTVYETGAPGIDGVSGIDVATLNAALSDVDLVADNSITFATDVDIAEEGINLSATAGVAGSDIDGLAAGQGTISVAGNFIRTNDGDITFHSGDNISVNNTVLYTRGGDLTMTSGDISINNNAAIGTQGGDVTLTAIAAGSGSSKTSGDVSTNSVYIDTTDPNAAGIGGITLFANGSPVDLGDYGNPQNFFVQDSNGGAIVISGKTVGGNSVCFSAGGVGCLVADPVAIEIIIMADYISKIYGSLDPLLTYTFTGTLQDGDSFTGSLTRDAGEDVAVSFYDIEQGSLDITGSGTYNITFVGNYFDILPAELVLLADDASKTYGDTLSFNGSEYTISSGQLFYSDTITGIDLSSLGATAGADVGLYDILGSNASGSGLSNYNITYLPGTLTVDPASLTVTANDDSKVYDSLAYSDGNGVSYSGFVNGDDSSDLGGTLAYGGDSQGAVSVGNYTITAGGLTSNNYTISYTDGALTVTPAPLTVTANDDSKTYDAVAYSGGNGVSYSGFVGSEDENVLGGTLAYGGDSQGAINVGDYTITASGLTAGNYTISYVDGGLSITPADLTVTADDQSKTYGDSFTFIGTEFSTSGLLGGDSVTGVTLTSLGAPAGADVGDYDIEAASASGSGLDNYSITYIDGTFAVNPAALTVTANDDSKVYDAVSYSGGNGVSYSGFVNGDDAGDLGGALAYGGDSQGAVDVGGYTITVGGLTSGNYDISYVDGDLVITAADLTITANDQSKTYGDTFTFDGTEFFTSGLLGGDSVTGVTLSSLGAPADANTGDYDIDASNATGSGLDNYTITYLDGTLTVDPALLSVLADDKTKTYGDADPTFTQTLSGLQNGESAGDVLSGTLDRDAGENVGDYDITQGTLTLISDNYILSFEEGTLTITPATLIVDADPKFKLFGESDPALTYQVSGLKFSDTAEDVLTGDLEREPGEDVGEYDILQGTLGLLGDQYEEPSNYSLIYIPDILTIDSLPEEPQVEVPLELIDPLDRPIISVANQAIVLDESFEEIETLELSTNVGIASQGPAPAEALAGLEPAAGGSDDLSAEQLAGIETAAGGDDEAEEGGDAFAQDIDCGNSFLDNRPCDQEN